MTQRIVVYLDTDTRGNDLVDSVGSPISAGYYVYSFPLDGEPLAGPFDDAHIATLADEGTDEESSNG